MNSDLKPCPFCGSENINLYKEPDIDVGGDFYSRKCRNCGARTAEKYARETCPIFFQGLRDAWNTRADTDALTAAQEENERLVHDIERLSASLSAEVTENERLRKAIEALGVMPEGYCFCSRHRIGDDSKIHEPECADLRSALNETPNRRNDND